MVHKYTLLFLGFLLIILWEKLDIKQSSFSGKYSAETLKNDEHVFQELP